MDLLKKKILLASEETEAKVENEEVFDEEQFVSMCSSFPPAPHLQYYYRIKTDKLIKSREHQQAANLLLTMQALTLRHQAYVQMTKRVKQTVIDVQKTKQHNQDLLDNHLHNIHIRRTMDSNSNRTVQDIVKTLPEEWTIVQISCHNSPQCCRFKQTKKDVANDHGNPNLCIVRVSNNGRGPRLRSLISNNKSDGVPYLQDVQNILKEHYFVIKEPTSNVKKYWTLRNKLNNRLKTLVQSMEDSWIGSAKGLLLGKLQSEESLNKINRCSQEVLDIIGIKSNEETTVVLETLLSSVEFLTAKQIFSELKIHFPMADEGMIYKAALLLHKYATNELRFLKEPREPVILILDPEIQSLPWESLPCMISSTQSVSRIPSLQYLSCLWQAHRSSKASVVPTGVSTDAVFYLVNPDNNLPKTQLRWEESVLKGFGDWEGCSGKPPKPGQLSEVLQKKDIYIFSGHGGGEKFLPPKNIEKMSVRVAPLLLGCSSGQLYRSGRTLDPCGMVHSYLIGTTPAMIGFLWFVTDVDVDNWTIRFLDYWLKGSQGNMLQAVADQRGSFTQFTNTAALVVYGLPISIKS